MADKQLLNLKQLINRNVQAVMPQEDQKMDFKKNISDYINKLKINENQSEEFQKGIFRDFLKTAIPDKQINTSDRIDLAIYNGKTSKSNVGVIVEYKKLDNKTEMMSKDNLNSKGFRELVSYYLKERIVNKNIEVKRGIVTNGYEFFVIDSRELEKHFIKNKKLVENFKKFEKRQLSGTTTDFLYDEVVAPEIDKALNKKIKIGYFNLQDYLVKGSTQFKQNQITQLYRFFSSENLLNEEIFSDSNSLNKNFYNELLYIMGLEEHKKSGNKVIDRLKENKRQYASLIENTIEQLDMKDVPKKDRFDIAIQLVVVWVNRILFLKLLESSLVSFNGSKDYKFLNYKKLHTFDDVNDLFFAVMAKRFDERYPRIKAEYPNVPYMNSSLFEATYLEKSAKGITINELREGDIEVYSKTKLKDSNGKKLTGKISVLDYLFRFLSAYDFTSAVEAKSKKEQDQLINASVLGLIFEKINGYKDGSFFTPGKITMYMAKRAVRQAVLTKVNEVMGWNVKNIVQLGMHTRDFDFSIEDRKKISNAIDDLKVLDPAVGSGHFLVSILNELIAIKSSLRVLFDSDGNLLNDIQCTVVNDELIVQTETGDNFSYDVNKPATLRIQKALFHQKQRIIENCLYGVDLNPNSVNICRLRLWIELLKNAYYSVDEEGNRILTTLPNIDINIKTGDSLIHRFMLNANFDLRKTDFKNYLSLVKQYKETSNKQVKADINKSIEDIKNKLFASFTTPAGERLRKLQNELGDVGQTNLFGKIDNAKFEELKKQAKEAQENYEKHRNDPMFSNSLEWRIEFPEVLDENGNFVGFDIVIANPPYIFARNQSFDEKTKQYYLSNYEVDEYQANTYTLFMELGYKLLKKNGTFAYIVPNNMLTIQSNQKIRDFLLKKSGSLVIINSLDKIFADANVDNCLVFLKKEKSDEVTVGELNKGDFETVGTVDKDFFGKENPIFSISMVKYRDAIGAYWKVGACESIKNKKIALLKSGIKAYEVGKGAPKITKEDKDNRIYHSTLKVDDTYVPYIEGKDVKRYLLGWSGEYIKYGPNLAAMRDPELFIGPRILVRQIPTKSIYSIESTYADSHIINDLNSMIISDIHTIHPLALLGILNSKIETLWFLMHFDKFQRRLFPQFKVNELAQFPIPDLNTADQNKIADLVKVIMKKAQSRQDYSKENEEVDELVMDAYGLTDEEKQEVRDFSF
ncbi:DUF7149 domain-containing protein [Lactobacillus johnsonii]|uniref:type IIG restriction enzyme/methyltransferase n=1 Tax=Lactobacillus johnsonii TaxID=33959 RepID=UPI000FD89EC6|nr:TaqI-like C-terminal specificity domain-containing protein [Lactobacillus johnsonii]